jgi:hypothetical protein
VLLLAGDVQGQNKAPVTQFQILIVVKKGDPQGSIAKGTVKALSEPVIVTQEGKPATFISGSHFPIAGDMVEAGLLATIIPERTEGGRIRLKVSLEAREVAQMQENHGIIKTVQARFSRVVHPGEVSHFSWPLDSERTWAEISVREIRVLGELTPRRVP